MELQRGNSGSTNLRWSLDALGMRPNSIFFDSPDHYFSIKFIHPFTSFLHHSKTASAMIQRNLLRASKSLSTSLPQRTLATPLRRSSPFLRYPAYQPSINRIASRWYSDSAETKTEAKEAEKPALEGASEVQTLKSSLEAKNKEVIELKVGL
jgi:hypothetical protein